MTVALDPPDYATYTQVIATLYIAIVIESGTDRILGARPGDTKNVKDRVKQEIWRRGWVTFALWASVLVLAADLAVLTRSIPIAWVTSVQVYQVWANVVVISGLALLTIFGWHWQRYVFKENRKAELSADAGGE